MKYFSIFIALLIFGFLQAETYRVTLNDKASDLRKDLMYFDVVTVLDDDDSTSYILNLTPQEALQIKLLYNIEPYKLKLNDNRDDYSDLKDINIRIDNISLNNSSLAQVFTIGNSVENRNIKAIRISSSEKNDLPEILFVGLHHAREWISYEVPLSIAEFMVSNYTSNTYVKDILDNSILWFVPMLNPDGYVFSRETDRMWRYNRKVHPDSTIGVDLNRNYDSSWIKVEYYHGEEPFSEPETQAIRDLVNGQTSTIPENKKINKLEGLITYHSYGQLILYPPGSTDEPPEEVKLYEELGSQMSGNIFSQCGSNYLVMQITGLYKTYGEMTEWFMINNDRKPAFTYELRPQMGNSAGFALSPEQINDTVKENIPAAFYFISSVIEGTTEIVMDNDDNGIADVIQGTEYEYECSRDDVPENDSDSSEIPDSYEDSDDTNNLGQVSDNDTEKEDVEDVDDSDSVIKDTSPDDNDHKSSGCSITKLI